MANPLKTINATGNLSLDLSHADAIVKIDKADGWTISLPPAKGSGAWFKVYVGTSISSNSGVIAANGTDVLQGMVIVATDTAGETMLTSATSDKMTLNGGTTGGLAGSHVSLWDVASGVWAVEGFLLSTGAEGTPFSAT
jgi:hypothetical protein